LRGRRPLWRSDKAKRERLANDVDCEAANERPMVWVCLIIGWGLLGRVLLG
jgi:hypothetical protein